MSVIGTKAHITIAPLRLLLLYFCGFFIFDLNQFKLFARDYRHGLLQDEVVNQARPAPVAIEDVTLHHHNDANAACCSS